VLTKYRWESLFHLKMYDELGLEVSKALDHHRAVKVINEESISTDISSTLLGLLLAEIKLITGQSDDAIQELYSIRNSILSNIRSDSRRQDWICWLHRTQSAIVNALIRQRLWRRAIAELTRCVGDLRLQLFQALGDNADRHTLGLVVEALILVFCRLSRTLLQVSTYRPPPTEIHLTRLCHSLPLRTDRLRWF